MRSPAEDDPQLVRESVNHTWCEDPRVGRRENTSARNWRGNRKSLSSHDWPRT